ncbi:solute carrier organic anion transporter family member 4A1-like [Anneissia japonica]|uniref:solute carrier organic anion transporter family member 4A1-like n=1 Tax=Anneissia japonica TaxID=1529436 RepID=UPI0014255AE1|nr:solute carrier organic anion transporter family member 4A1-like [Anneissia japonica]XP_033109638.1 solute carrier organic anion transporter family member 4A1-like [Anneissia japonica]
MATDDIKKSYEELDNDRISAKSKEDNDSPAINGNNSVEAKRGIDDEFEDDGQCGWGAIKPDCAQKFNNAPGFLFFACLFAITQGMTVNGIIYVVTTTIEKRFDLPSVKSGFISSCYDVAVMVVIVFVTYFGENSHKPRWIGLGALLFAAGSLLFTTPHYLTPFYDFQSTDFKTCDRNSSRTEDCDDDSSSYSKYYAIFVVAQLLHGVGASPLYTLGVTYIDDNVPQKMTAFYLGILNASSLLGPAIGYLLGGVFLSIYTDVRVDTSMLGIDSSSPLWVGAWWLGLLLSSSLSFFVAIPFLGFPKFIPGHKELAKERVSEAHCGSNFQVRAGFGNSLRDFPRAVIQLIKNVPFMFINLSAITEWFLLAGFAVFAPKFVESQFSLSSSWAAILVGLIIIPASIGGAVAGGWFVKHFKLRFRGMIKFCLGALFISFLCIGAFLVNCPDVDFAGVTVAYGNSSIDITNEDANLDSLCNNNCACSTQFNPVCGTDNIMYFSACHAGCATIKSEDDTADETYSDCTCVEAINGSSEAVLGKCTTNCPYQGVFLAFLFLLMFTTILAVVPSQTATLRCVPHSQRSFGLGLQSLLWRAFGSVPGPVIFGAVIDKTCILWEDSCGSQGSCWLYSNRMFSRYSLYIGLAVKVCSLVFLTLALITYKPPPESPPPEKADRQWSTSSSDQITCVNYKESNSTKL